MGFLKGFYGGLVSSGNFVQAFVLLAIRLYWGWGLFQLGLNKLRAIDQTTVFLQTLHIPFPEFSSYAVGGIECVGGALLILGLAARFAAIPLMIVLIVALFTAHYEAVRVLFTNPLLVTKQHPFYFLMASFVVFIFGPGRISLDGLLDRTYFKSGNV